MQFYCQNTIQPKKDTKLCLHVEKWSRSVIFTESLLNPPLCRFRIESVNVLVLPRFDLCHVLSSSTNNFAHAQTLSRMSSLSWRMNIARVNIGFFSGFKKIIHYLRLKLCKISNATVRIFIFFNIKSCQYSMFYSNCSWNFS
jgi:hypothetical protein